jgi:hypothetical protein
MDLGCTQGIVVLLGSEARVGLRVFGVDAFSYAAAAAATARYIRFLRGFCMCIGVEMAICETPGIMPTSTSTGTKDGMNLESSCNVPTHGSTIGRDATDLI